MKTAKNIVNETSRNDHAKSKAAKSELQSQHLSDAILDSALHMVIALDLDGKVIMFNKGAEKALGYRAKDVVGKYSHHWWHDHAEVERRAAELSIELGRPIKPGLEAFAAKTLLYGSEESEWTFIRADGARFPGKLIATLLKNKQGDAIGFLGIMHNITNQKRQEEAVRTSEENFRLALEFADIAMGLMTPEGKWLSANKALNHLLGYTKEEMSMLSLQAITHPEDIAADIRYLGQVLDGEINTFQMEKRYFRKDGETIWALMNVALVRETDGKPRYFICQFQDITMRKRVERMKNEFISTVSHELRTPLTSIRGALGLVATGAAGAVADEAKELIGIAYNNSIRLARIINDILDIEKIESGSLQIHLKPVDVAYILKQALKENAPYAEKYRVHFVLGAVPVAEVAADPDRLMQVMANLLSNAAKFSPPGSAISVSAEIHDKSIRFSVEDHGTGIPKEFRPHIFEKFVQADNSDSRKFEGTGLGLSITKKLVEAMKGSIDFETEIDIGTRFYFDLPIAERTARILENAAPMAGKHLILHIEDDQDLTRIVQGSLRDHAHILTAGNLREAEDLLPKHHFDLIILDPNLPDGNGLKLLHQLPAQAPPVMILSANEMDRKVQDKVAAALVKSHASEQKILDTVVLLLPS